MSGSTEVVGKSIAIQPAKAAVDHRQSQRLMLLGIFAVMAILQFAVLESAIAVGRRSFFTRRWLPAIVWNIPLQLLILREATS